MFTGPRVLVADDDPGMAKAVSRLLTMDCDVLGVVTDGGALLEAVRRLHPDVIVLDVNLPTLHGLEACRQIIELNPAAKIIVFTAMDDPEVRQRALAVGAAAFVSKLAAVDELRSTIKRLCTDSTVGGAVET